MKSHILKKIKEIEKKEGIKVLFLIESGSRAWNFASKDSDYDVRGVFVQDYLKVTDHHEQISEIDGEIDVVLWDLRKFLRLLLKSNPSVWEWLSSDIVYIENPLRKILMKEFSKNFNRYKLKKHYASMAEQNFNKYIRSSETTANLKKYVYVLRSLACILWIEKHKSPPPKKYNKVIGLLRKDVKAFFEEIVEKKKQSESMMGKRKRDIESYVVGFFNRKFKKDTEKFDPNRINKLFKKTIMANK